MSSSEIPAPHLATAYSGPLHHIEEVILNQVSLIESWFRTQWQITPPPITSSVDLRYAGFKLAPVDTNLFPAGFNNLNPDFIPLCIQAAQSVFMEYYPTCTNILLLPENHTRNQFYLESLCRLRDIFVKAGFVVRIGSLDEHSTKSSELTLESGETLLIEPVIRSGDRVGLPDFDPCFLLLNNDLSTGVPDILSGVVQTIQPPVCLGWSSRLKSTHFHHYSEVAHEFSKLIDIDSWLITPLFKAVEGIDFMSQEGIDKLVEEVDALLVDIRAQYDLHGVKEKPFVVVKADNGTYGMGVMMVHEAAQLLSLNRKQRKKMAASKGSQTVTKVIVQEGVHSIETMPDLAVAEPVVYMLGDHVIGGFYRVHKDRGPAENLNAIGMHFEPLAFSKSCNMPEDDLGVEETPNRFYIYGVIARLAALAAAREMAALGGAR
jgi:glutamate--cysteine ligase